jgi:xanthine dehydrogenase YagS FAD-binding subunit
MRNFDYLQPTDPGQAAMALANHAGSQPMAGGTDLLDLMKSGLAVPDQLVNLKALDDPELRAIEERDGVLRVGALATLREIAESQLLSDRCAVLQQAAASAASPQLRNIGTLGGNLCQRPRCWYFRDADFNCLRKGGSSCFAVDGRNRFHSVIGGGPCHIVHPSDTAVALLALDANVIVVGDGTRRDIPIAEFFVLPSDDVERETVLLQGEFVVGVEIPASRADLRSSYTKFRYRESWDFAVVSVALVLEGPGKGGRIALGGVAPVPWLDERASSMLAGVDSSEAGLKRLGATLLEGAESLGENAYKLPLTRNLVKRAVADLLA